MTSATTSTSTASAARLAGTYRSVGEMFTGTEGICYGRRQAHRQGQSAVPEIKLESDNGMVQEHVDLIRSVMAGKPLNDAERIAESTLVAIMGRISAYTGQLVRWNDLVKNEASPFYSQLCTPTALDFEKGPIRLPAEVPAVPGKA